jgi:hypothetical protein
MHSLSNAPMTQDRAYIISLVKLAQGSVSLCIHMFCMCRLSFLFISCLSRHHAYSRSSTHTPKLSSKLPRVLLSSPSLSVSLPLPFPSLPFPHITAEQMMTHKHGEESIRIDFQGPGSGDNSCPVYPEPPLLLYPRNPKSRQSVSTIRWLYSLS